MPFSSLGKAPAPLEANLPSSSQGEGACKLARVSRVFPSSVAIGENSP